MTTTAIISGQSIGTSTNVGNDKFAAKLTAGTTTTAFVVSAKLTLGAGPTNPGIVRVRFTSASFNVTAANGPAHLGQTSRYLDLVLSGQPGSSVLIKDGTLETLTGSYIHVWVDAPTLGTAASLDVNVVELP